MTDEMQSLIEATTSSTQQEKSDFQKVTEVINEAKSFEQLSGAEDDLCMMVIRSQLTEEEVEYAQMLIVRTSERLSRSRVSLSPINPLQLT